ASGKATANSRTSSDSLFMLFSCLHFVSATLLLGRWRIGVPDFVFHAPTIRVTPEDGDQLAFDVRLVCASSRGQLEVRNFVSSVANFVGNDRRDHNIGDTLVQPLLDEGFNLTASMYHRPFGRHQGCVFGIEAG